MGVPEIRGSGLLDSCYGLVLVSSFELDGCQHARQGVASLPFVPDLKVFEDRVRQLDARAPALSVPQLDLHRGPERLDHRTVEAVPTEPIDRSRPEWTARWVHAQEVNWPDSSGRCNTSMMEVLDGDGA